MSGIKIIINKNKKKDYEKAGSNTDLSRKDRIIKCQSTKGTRKERRREKHSKKFNEMFEFFLKSYRYNILSFSGTYNPKIIFNVDGKDGKICMKEYDNGIYKNKPIYTRHPNILNGIIKGKKSWGLWVKEWSIGISECNFTRFEILKEFEVKDIKIPKSIFLLC